MSVTVVSNPALPPVRFLSIKMNGSNYKKR